MDRTLLAFLVVAEEGNLTSAAVKVGLTQPALTKMIRRLERDYEAPLFDRTSRGMNLTRAGAKLRDRAKRIEIQYRQSREEIKSLVSGSLPHFSIGAGAAYHMEIAPDIARILSDEFPETKVRLDFNVADLTLPRLVAGDVDLMLGAIHDRPPEGIETAEIIRVDIVPYCRKSDRLARLDLVRPEDVANRRWVIYRRDDAIVARMAGFFSDSCLPPPDIAMEVEALAASFRIVANSDKLTLAPLSLANVAEQFGLVPLHFAAPIWSFGSGAWYRTSSREYPIMRRALDLLPQLASETLAIPGSYSRGVSKSFPMEG
ncbi:LysR family transcriptional regulator [Rhizobium sp. BE258]|uniref:LysR family transcriptional regulator n=1 Tax=Rhizobium sp. BE258 TaxID=2817722 RepID=UPI002866F09F|nr:LysR family transcriptional regulator [Rhizobium sp. BE258]MDR7145175.1 DNA-binding transcriptional LysR family regulator [Rhizobium sp. BE258]